MSLTGDGPSQRGAREKLEGIGKRYAERLKEVSIELGYPPSIFDPHNQGMQLVNPWAQALIANKITTRNNTNKFFMPYSFSFEI